MEGLDFNYEFEKFKKIDLKGDRFLKNSTILISGNKIILKKHIQSENKILESVVEILLEENIEKSLLKLLEFLIENIKNYGNPQNKEIQKKFLADLELYKVLRIYLIENFDLHNELKKDMLIDSYLIQQYYNLSKNN